MTRIYKKIRKVFYHSNKFWRLAKICPSLGFNTSNFIVQNHDVNYDIASNINIYLQILSTFDLTSNKIFDVN
jgi:hypothetical protein